MTTTPETHTTSPPASHTPLRLRLKPKAPVTGYIDGAWWPRSRDLTTELAGLAEVLAVRLGTVERVAYALSAWEAAPPKVDVNGVRIRLRASPPRTSASST